MTTASLTAQDIRLAPGSLLLRDSAGTKASWGQHHDLDNLYFSLDATAVECNITHHQLGPASVGSERQCSCSHKPYSPGARLPPKKCRPSHITLPTCVEPSSPGPSPPEGDQVVPSFQRLSVYERAPSQAAGRCARPLPPLPLPGPAAHDQVVDSEVEFFTSTDDIRCLVPELCPRSLAFRYGAPSRRSFRGCGQINYAYFDGPGRPCVPEPPEPEPERPVPVSAPRPHRCLHRSHSGPAGSFHKPVTRLLGQPHSGHAQNKPEVPPRVPLPPRPLKATDCCRRWSAEVPSGACGNEDKPPKVPPREPLSGGGSRTPSPKSLPMYLNGVMPPTQSFAPDPKYVSRTLQRQNSEGSPCILPIMENGRKASTTHYFLLPQRPAYLDKLEKFLREKEGDTGHSGVSGLDCAWLDKANPQLDFV